MRSARLSLIYCKFVLLRRRSLGRERALQFSETTNIRFLAGEETCVLLSFPMFVGVDLGLSVCIGKVRVRCLYRLI